MKINWGTGLAIAMGAFMLFILSFVYKAFTNDKYDHHLVSEEYYIDEMNYQQEIDALVRANELKTNVKLITTEQGIRVVFPLEVELNKIKGTVDFQRASDVKLDFSLPIVLSKNEFLIPENKLVKGLYNVKVDWSIDTTRYLFKDKYTY